MKNYLSAIPLLLLPLMAPLGASATVVNSLDPAALNSALQGGGTVTFSVDGTIVLTNTITLSNTVTLDGTNHSITISGGGTVQLFQILSPGNVSFRNLTLANGFTNGEYYPMYVPVLSPTTAYGAAILNQATVDIEGCTVTNNHASGGSSTVSGFGQPDVSAYGGAIYNSGALTVTNTLFVNNSAVGGGPSERDTSNGGNGLGGAICNQGGSMALSGVSFVNNNAGGGVVNGSPLGNSCGNAYGGAIYSSGGTLNAWNLSMTGNSATGGSYSAGISSGHGSSGGSAGGGDLYLASGSATIAGSSFLGGNANGGAGNAATSGAGQGGGIFSAGTLSLTNCFVSGNQAHGGAANIYGPYTSMLVPGAAGGGGIYNTGQMQIFSGTVSNNTVVGGLNESLGIGGDAYGGGIYNTGYLQTSSASAIAGNLSSGGSGMQNGNGEGGGLANFGFTQIDATTISSNSIIAATNYGLSIYNKGVIQNDSSSSLISVLPGAGPYSFQWQDNGSNLSGQTSATLNLDQIQFGAAGNYDLLVSNGVSLAANYLQVFNQPAAPLAITNISPAAGPVGGYTTVTISGSGFLPGAHLYFSNAEATISALTSNSITASTPPQNMAELVNVTFVNGDYVSLTVTNAFGYYGPHITLTGIPVPGLGVQLQFEGMPSTNYVLLETTSLIPPINWQPVVTNLSASNGWWSFTDSNALSSPPRYYQVQLP